MLFHKQSALIALGTLIVFALGLTGCDGGGSNTVANVRVFNGVSGSNAAGGVNVALRQPTAVPVNAAPIAYGQVSPNRRISSDDAQNTYLFFGNSTNSVSTQKFDYPSDSNNTANTTGELLVAAGVAGQTSGDAAPKLIYVRTSVPIDQIRNGNTPTANALLRMVNAAPGTGAISLFNDQGAGAVFSDLSGITFGNYSSGGNTRSNYATLTAAMYNLSVRDAQSHVLVSIPNIALQPGFAYTLIVFGSPTASFNSPVVVAFTQDYPLQ